MKLDPEIGVPFIHHCVTKIQFVEFLYLYILIWLEYFLEEYSYTAGSFRVNVFIVWDGQNWVPKMNIVKNHSLYSLQYKSMVNPALKALLHLLVIS